MLHLDQSPRALQRTYLQRDSEGRGQKKERERVTGLCELGSARPLKIGE